MTAGALRDPDRPGPTTWLTEVEVDRLTECECGHYTNEHSSDGCLANTDDPEWADDQERCFCWHSPHAIRVHALESVVRARVAAERERIAVEIEALPLYPRRGRPMCAHEVKEAAARIARSTP